MSHIGIGRAPTAHTRTMNQAQEAIPHGSPRRGLALRSALYILPVVVMSGFFIYYCIGFSLLTSFTDWDGTSLDMHWRGFKNYAKLLRSGSVFWTALGNNLFFLVVTVLVQAAVGLLLAVILKERMPGSNFFKAVFFMPIAMTPAIISAIFRNMLDSNIGSINVTLRAMHLDLLAHDWLGDPKLAMLSVCAINIFEWMGFSMIIYYAGLMSIPDEIYEAAKIDGAGFWNTLFHVTLPMLRGTTNTLIVLGIVGSLKTFDIVWLTTKGGPGYSTEFLNTYLYRQAFVVNADNSGAYSSAVGVMILIIAVVLSLAQITLSNHDK